MMAMRKHRAFTLIELLVVVSIVTMLVAILLPALKAARATGQSIACLSNERQQGLALAMYANDFDGWLVPYRAFTNQVGGYTYGSRPFWPAIPTDLGYMPRTVENSIRTAFACPTQVSNEDSVPVGWWRSTHYGINFAFSFWTAGQFLQGRIEPFGRARRDNITGELTSFLAAAAQPSEVALLGDYVANSSQRPHLRSGYASDRHPSRSTNVLYFDTHAASMPHDDIPADPWDKFWRAGNLSDPP